MKPFGYFTYSKALVWMLLLSFCMVYTPTIAQNSKKKNQMEEDVIYLKDGSVIRGQIVEQVPAEYVKIELLGGSVFVFQLEEVEVIKKEGRKLSEFYSYAAYQAKRDRTPTFRRKGLYHLINLGVGVGRDRWDWVVGNVSLDYAIGTYINQYLGIGGGFGMTHYDMGGILPFYLDLRGDLMKTKLTPHYFAQVGYGIPFTNNWGVNEPRGGLYLSGGLGYKLHTSRKAEWIFGVGYKYFNGTFLDELQSIETNMQYQRFVFQTAFSF